MSAPGSSPSQTEREAAGIRGGLPGKVHVLPGAAVRADDGTRALPQRPAPAPSAGELARTLAGAGACAVIAGAVAAIYSPVLAVVVVAPFAGVAAWETRRWWRGRGG